MDFCTLSWSFHLGKIMDHFFKKYQLVNKVCLLKHFFILNYLYVQNPSHSLHALRNTQWKPKSTINQFFKCYYLDWQSIDIYRIGSTHFYYFHGSEMPPKDCTKAIKSMTHPQPTLSFLLSRLQKATTPPPIPQNRIEEGRRCSEKP